jgi:molybdopterin/thiamine biosynthesis adenylyltransferase
MEDKMKVIYVFGLGALGSNILLQLAKKYPQCEFNGIDYDVVEERNINTQVYLLPHIGMPKAGAMRIVLGMKLRKFTYHGINKRITTITDIEPLFKVNDDILFIDCFDNSKSRQIIQDYPYDMDKVHIGFSPQYTAEIIWKENYTVPNDIPADQNDICEMTEAIPFINFVTGFAAGVISNYLDNGIKEDYIIVNKYKIKKL